MDRNRWLREVQVRSARGDVAGTLEAWRAILAMDPGDAEVLSTMGELHLKAGQHAEALEHLGRAADAHRRMGYTLKALAVARRVVDAFPDDAAGHARLADIRAEQGHLADAQDHYLKAATLMREAGQVDRALEVLRRSSELAVRSPGAGANLGHRQAVFEQFIRAGVDFLRVGQLNAAVEVLRLARAMQPQARVPLRLLVNALVKQQNVKDAIALLAQLVATQPQDAELLLLLGRAYAADGNLAGAVAAYTALLHVDPSAYAPILEVGRRYMAAGDADGAVMCVDQAIGTMIDRHVEYRAASYLVEVCAAFPEHAGARDRLAYLEKWIAEHRGEAPTDEPRAAPRLDTVTTPRAPRPAPAAPSPAREDDVPPLAPATEPPVPVPPSAMFNSVPPPLPVDMVASPTSQATPFLEHGDAAVDEVQSLENLRRVYVEEGMGEKAATVCMTLAALERARGNVDRARELEAESMRLQRASESAAAGPVVVQHAPARGVDALTGLADRASLEDTLAREWRRGQRDGKALSLAIIDVDHLADFNEAGGRATGDRLLRRVSAELFAVLRRAPDIVARHDGDAFAVLLPETTLEGARVVVERMLERIRALAIPHPTREGTVLTASAGLAMRVPRRDAFPGAVLDAADRALLEAKRQGRDRVVVAGPEDVLPVTAVDVDAG